MRPHSLNRHFITALLTASPWVGSRIAHAGDLFSDPYDLPDSPRPPTLPELTHGEIEATAESTIGIIAPSPEAKPNTSENSALVVQRFNVEIPVWARRYFVGATYELSIAEPPGKGGPTRFVPGNLEIYGRTVWANRTGLAFGGGMGVMAPTAVFPANGAVDDAAQAAAALRSWDYAFFQPSSFALRPFVDVRDIDGNFVVHFRQGVDWIVNVADTNQMTLAAVSALYLGYRLTPLIGIGIEGFDYYLIEGDVAENRRANVIVSPGVRFETRYVQPSVSAFTNLTTLFDPAVAQVWGMRLAVTFVWDKETRTLGLEHR